jgi:hypothetical protein
LLRAGATKFKRLDERRLASNTQSTCRGAYFSPRIVAQVRKRWSPDLGNARFNKPIAPAGRVTK